LVVFLAAVAAGSGASQEVFTEELYLKPLANGQVLAFAKFTTLSGEVGGKMRHFDLMPRVVGEFVDDHGLHELRVSLTRGVWRLDSDHGAAAGAPAGALVTAVFDDDAGNGDNVDTRWRRLTNSLSGQFCASLNFLDSALTSRPEWSLGPMGTQPPQTTNGTWSKRNLRYGTLAGENVCTENLTPWKKLLPCASRRGLGSLLNARSIHRTSYHSIGLTVRRVCPKEEEEGCFAPKVELSQTVTLVFDPSSFPENANKVTSKESGVKLNGYAWSLRTLFGIGINSKCPLASESTVFVATGPEMDLRMDPKAKAPPLQYKKDKVFVYDVEEMLADGKHNIVIGYPDGFVAGKAAYAAVITATRYQTGHGQETGGIVTQIRNSGAEAVTVVLYDVLPWYLRVYFHTLRVEARLSHNRIRTLVPARSEFVPGLDRSKPYTVELVVTLPPNSVTKVSVDFEHSILKWNEYPPDANKGFYVGPALVTTLLRPDQTQGLSLDPRHSTLKDQLTRHSTTDRVLVQLYTEPLLISLPTPDFSMPYNVICLACTVVALAFGPLLNLTTKILQVEEVEVAPPTSLSQKLKGLLSKVPLLNRKCQPKVNETKDSQDDTDKDTKKDR